MSTKPIRSHLFRGHRWRIHDYTELPPNDLGEVRYWCKKVFIPTEGELLGDLDIIIHEGLHVCTELEEDAVDETATSIARLLWRLGWRKEL